MKFLKTVVRKSLRSVRFDVDAYQDRSSLMKWDLRFGLNVFGLVANEFLRSRPDQVATLLQIGVNDGLQQDPVRPVLEHGNVRAVLVNPVATVYERLQANYSAFENVRTVNRAIRASDGTLTPGHVGEASLVSSFDRRQVEQFRVAWGLQEDQLITHGCLPDGEDDPGQSWTGAPLRRHGQQGHGPHHLQ
jgi:hypothetical protein